MSDAPIRSGLGTLERTLGRLRRKRHVDAGDPPTHLSPDAFRAIVNERLRSLQRQMDEVKGRVNGLIFLLVGAVAAQIVLGLIG